mmetsp:Transcript_15010/g.37391  ORF Transcript_15010/g.37391 Transcript_15010/m.37391 type:complete len:234 (+) Transcript_15010:343-1044(+)
MRSAAIHCFIVLLVLLLVEHIYSTSTFAIAEASHPLLDDFLLLLEVVPRCKIRQAVPLMGGSCYVRFPHFDFSLEPAPAVQEQPHCFPIRLLFRDGVCLEVDVVVENSPAHFRPAPGLRTHIYVPVHEAHPAAAPARLNLQLGQVFIRSERATHQRLLRHLPFAGDIFVPDLSRRIRVSRRRQHGRRSSSVRRRSCPARTVVKVVHAQIQEPQRQFKRRGPERGFSFCNVGLW